MTVIADTDRYVSVSLLEVARYIVYPITFSTRCYYVLASNSWSRLLIVEPWTNATHVV